MYHIQFCSILGMIAVNWPEFACEWAFVLARLV
jgi:hypothetical protein